MREGFVALASMLRRDAASPDAVPVIVAAAAPPRDQDPSPVPAAMADVVRLRLAAREAFERAIELALDGFAREVLGRELSLAPADVARLAARARSDFAECEPVGLVVAPDDAASLDGFPLPFRVDGGLERGDVVVEVTGGSLESTTSFRLRRVLDESFAAACAGRLRA